MLQKLKVLQIKHYQDILSGKFRKSFCSSLNSKNKELILIEKCRKIFCIFRILFLHVVTGDNLKNISGDGPDEGEEG